MVEGNEKKVVSANSEKSENSEHKSVADAARSRLSEEATQHSSSPERPGQTSPIEPANSGTAPLPLRRLTLAESKPNSDTGSSESPLPFDFPQMPADILGLTPQPTEAPDFRHLALRDLAAGNSPLAYSDRPALGMFIQQEVLKGNGDSIRQILAEQEQKSVDSKYPDNLQELKTLLANEEKYARYGTIPPGSPLHLLADATLSAEQGSTKNAEAGYKAAIEAADRLNRGDLAVHVRLTEQEAKEMANSPYRLLETERRKQAWQAMSDSPALARQEYANFLLDHGRKEEAQKVLDQISKTAPADKGDYRQKHPELEALKAEANKPDSAIGSALKRFAEAAKGGDQKEITATLAEAKKAAQEIEKDPGKLEAIKAEKSKLEEEIKNGDSNPGKLRRLAELEVQQYASSYVKIAESAQLRDSCKYSEAEQKLNELTPEFQRDHRGIKEQLVTDCKKKDDVASLGKEYGKDLASNLVAYGIKGPWGIVAGIATYVALQAYSGNVDRSNIGSTAVRGLANATIGKVTGLAAAAEGAAARTAAEAGKISVVTRAAVALGPFQTNLILGTGLPVVGRTMSEGYSYLTGAHKNGADFRQAFGKGVALDVATNPINAYPNSLPGLILLGTTMARNGIEAQGDEQALNSIKKLGLLPTQRRFFRGTL